MSAILNFLIAFDHGKNEMVELTDFGTDLDSATAAYADAETKYRDSHTIDIVLVGSDSLESVKVTHSNYFKDGAIKRIEEALNIKL